MSRLDAAAERFHAALENLNKKTAPLAEARESAAAAAIRLAAITEERDRLTDFPRPKEGPGEALLNLRIVWRFLCEGTIQLPRLKERLCGRGALVEVIVDQPDLTQLETL